MGHSSLEVPDGYDDLLSITNIKVNGNVNILTRRIWIYPNSKSFRFTNGLCVFSKRSSCSTKFWNGLTICNNEDADYELTNPLELDDIILGNILVEKPFRVIHPEEKIVNLKWKKSRIQLLPNDGLTKEE